MYIQKKKGKSQSVTFTFTIESKSVYYVIIAVPSSIQAVKNETVTEGDNVTLICTASGIPSPTVSWIKASGNQRTYSDVWVFKNISRSEAGEYRCEASNECGDASESTSIDVQCKFIMNSFTCTCHKHKKTSEFGPECLQVQSRF